MSRIEELSRRGFLKEVAGVVVTSQIEGLSYGATASVTANAASSVNLRVTDSSLVLGNDEVELEIDRQTGFFKDIVNKHTGFHHKLEGTGVWPFGMCLGNAREPNLLRVEITNRPLSPQVMKYRDIRGGDDRTGGRGKTLELRYDDLISTGGTMTGIKLAVFVTLKQGADYFLIRARVENGSKHGITNLYGGTGELVADVSRDKETLAAPGWSCGTVWNNPHAYFVERETFGYPIFGSQAGLAAGWLDLFGEKGGIGTAYLNRQGLSMYFNVQQEGKGLKINWQLFSLSHQKAVDRWTNVEGIYPLEPAKQFETDTWILAAHNGDWHRMADIYRTEYEEAFKGEYLTWDDTHEVARNLDVITNYTILNIRDELGGKPTPAVRNKFSDVPPLIHKLVDAIGVSPDNLLVDIWGYSNHFPYYMPDFMPCCPEGGGDEACRKMMSDLREMGVAGVMLYAHLFYDHPKAHDYVPEADTGYDHQNALWKNIGNIGCVNCDPWVNLWRSKYIPGFDSLGASGAFLDQGCGQYVVCTMEGHRHGTDAVGMLSGQVSGVLSLLKQWREEAKSRRPFFWTEGGSDVQARLVDIWSRDVFSYTSGGTSREEIVRYTFPYRLCAYVDVSASSINRALVNGFIIGGWIGVDEMLKKFEESPESAETLRQFVRIRRTLRAEKAPGYPYGFRDIVGLTVSSPDLIARAFQDQDGITVVYYGKEAVEATVRVDKAALSHSSGDETFEVRLRKHQVCWFSLKWREGALR